MLTSGLVGAASVGSLQAQTTINYSDGETNSADYSVSAPYDPTTLRVTIGSATQSGNISGTGSVIKSGTGTLTLSGANSYAGGTFIEEGVVNFGASGLGTGDITLNGGSLQWGLGNTDDISSRLHILGTSGTTFDTNGNDVTLANAFSGAGIITKMGNGRLTITASNTTYGAMTVSEGILQLGDVGTVALKVKGDDGAGGTLGIMGTFSNFENEGHSGAPGGDGGNGGTALIVSGSSDLAVNHEAMVQGGAGGGGGNGGFAEGSGGMYRFSGGRGGGGGKGGSGGTAVILSGSNGVTGESGAVIQGGAGGVGGAGGQSVAGIGGIGGDGGFGGTAMILSGMMSADSNGVGVSILGGKGGNGGGGADGPASKGEKGGKGGEGGAAVTRADSMGGPYFFTNLGVIEGGLGGGYGKGSDSYGSGQYQDRIGGEGGEGGNGGVALILSGNVITVTNAAGGEIVGGGGGTGGEGGYSNLGGYTGPNGGKGGSGGTAISLLGSNNLVSNDNAGVIQGGNGGNGGTGGVSGYRQGSGGDGGTGGSAILLGELGHVDNSSGGFILGGNGGGPGNTLGQNVGAGGTAIRFSGGSGIIVNSGIIQGGLSGDGTTRANAIDFTGSGNQLILKDGSSLVGNVVVSGGGTNNTVLFDGNADRALNLSEVTFQGFSDVRKTGTGALTLVGTTSVAMPWKIEAGTLKINQTGSLAVGTVTLAGGDLLSGATATIGSDIHLAASANLAAATGTTASYSGTISGGSALTIGDSGNAGTVIFSGSNTYTGTTTVSAGTLRVSDGSIHSSSSIAVAETSTLQISQTTGSSFSNVIVNDGRIILTQGSGITSTLSGAIDGSGRIIQSGTGTTILSGTNTYTGGTTINAGLINFGAQANLGAGNITVNGGTLQWATGSTVDISSRLTALDSGGATFDTNGNDITFATGMFGANGALIKIGAGTLTLTGNSTHTGLTTISSGTLQIGDGGDTGTVAGDILNNASLAFNRSDEVTYNKVINGTGSVTKLGANTLFLRGNNTYAGGTIIDGGTLNFSASSLGTGTIALNDGILQWATGNTLDISSRLTSVGTNGAVLDTNGNNVSLASAFSGSWSLTKLGTGTLALSAANTYTGGTTVNEGTLQMGDGGTTGGITGDILNNANFAFNRSDAISSSNVISGSGSLTQSGTGTVSIVGENTYTGGTTINAGTLQLGNGGTTGSIRGDIVTNANLALNHSDARSFAQFISGTGGVTQAGTGILTLTGANTYEGGTTVNAGTTLKVGADAVDHATSALGNQSNTATINGTLDLNGHNQGVGDLISLGLGGTVLNSANGTNSILTVEGGDAYVRYYGQIADNAGGGTTGTVSLHKTGEGTLHLYNGSSYSGGTTVDGGVLQIGPANGNGLSDSASVIVNGGVLQLTSSETIGSLSGSGGFIGITTRRQSFLPKDTLTVNQTTDGTYAGGITDYVFDEWGNYVRYTGNLTKTGAGTLTLGGDLAYLGTTTITQGGLVISGGLGADLLRDDGAARYNGAIINNGSLTFSSSDHVQTLSGIISGTGSLTTDALYTLTLSADNTYTGLTTISSGTLQVGEFGSTGSIAGNIVNEGTLDFFRSTDSTYAGVISGSGAVGKAGSGKLILTGNNTYTGGTTSSDAPLQLGDGGTTGSIVGDVSNHGGLIFNRSDAVHFGGAISGGGGVTQSGTGTLTMTGANSYTGGTTIDSGGTLKVGVAQTASTVSALGNQGNSATVNGTLDLDGNDQSVGALSGSGKVINGSDVTSRTLTVGHGDATSTFAGVIADNGGNGATGTLGLTKTGAGALTLEGANTYTGATTIDGGTLVLKSSNPLSGASLVLNANHGVITSGGVVTGWADQSGRGNDASAGEGVVTLGNLNGLPALVFDGGSYLNNPLSGASSNYSIFSVFQVEGTSGTQTILGSVADGNFQFRLNDDHLDVLQQGVADLANSSGSVVAGNPTLGGATVQNDYQAFFIGGAAAGEGYSGYYPGDAAATFIGSNGNHSENFTGKIAALVVFDSVLSASRLADVQNYLSHEFFGQALISSGGSLSSSTAVDITASGAALDLNGNTQTIGSLAGVDGSAVYLGGGALTVGSDNSSTIFGGVLSDSGGLQSSVGGTLTRLVRGHLPCWDQTPIAVEPLLWMELWPPGTTAPLAVEKFC